MKKILLSIGIVIIILLISGFATWNYFITTPAYSFFQIYNAVKEKDYTTFSKYADVDSIVTNVVNKAMDKAQADMEKTSNQSTLGDFGKSLGEGLLVMMKPALIESAKSAIKKGVESGSLFNADKNTKSVNLFAFFSQTKVKKDGNNVDVIFNTDDKKPVTFKMKQTKDKYWQIYDMDVDLSSAGDTTTDVSASNTKRVKFGQRVSIGAGWFITVAKPIDYVSDSFFSPQDDDKFVAVEAIYENTTNTADSFSISNLKLKDTQNHQYTPTYVGGKEPALDGSSLEAHGKVDGFVTFEVPQTATLQSVIYSNSEITIVFSE